MNIFVYSVVIGIGLALLINYLRMRRRRDTFVRPIPPTVVKWTVCGITAVVLKNDWLVAAQTGQGYPYIIPGRTLTFAPADHWVWKGEQTALTWLGWKQPNLSRFLTGKSEELETMLDGFIVEQAPFFVPFSSDGLACWDWQMENFQPIPIDEARRLLESGKRH